MPVNKLTKKNAFRHDTEALKGWYYQLPDFEGGRSVIYAEVTGDHGQRKVGERGRIYYIIDGEGVFSVNGEETEVQQGDVMIIPPYAQYGYRATKSILRLVLFMDMIDLTKLPSQKK